MGASASVKVQPQPGKRNFYRVTALLVEGSANVLRDVFDSIHPLATLPIVLSNSTTKAKLRETGLTQPQWDMVYPNYTKYGKSEDFDVPLIVHLLRTICYLSPPSTGWDKMPNNSDKSTSADIVRLKCLRNTLYSYALEPSVGDKEFERLWGQIGDTLTRLAGVIGVGKEREWKRTMKSMREKPLKPEGKQNVNELKEWYRRDFESKEFVDRGVQTERERPPPSVEQSSAEYSSNKEVMRMIKRQFRTGTQQQLKKLSASFEDAQTESKSLVLSLEQKVAELSTGKEMIPVIKEHMRTVLEEQTKELSMRFRHAQKEQNEPGTLSEQNDAWLGTTKEELIFMIRQQVESVMEEHTSEIRHHIDECIEKMVASTCSKSTCSEPVNDSEKCVETTEHQTANKTAATNKVGALHLACVEGDVLLIKAKLDEGLDVNESSTGGITPIMAAAAFGQTDAVEMLLCCGANLQKVSEKEWNALHFASTNETATILEMLLDAGEDIDGETNDEGTALMIAAYCGRIGPVRALLSRGANIHAVDEDGWNALHHACKTDNIRVIELLLRAGVDINQETDDAQTAITIASAHGQRSVLRFVRSRCHVNAECAASV